MLAIAAVGALVMVLNASSDLIEALQSGAALDPRAPFVWEITSFLIVLPAALAIGWAIRRCPFRASAWLRWGALHLSLATSFSLVHVLGMVWLRKLAYAAAGSVYEFSHGRPLLMFFYEWRKDVLAYAAIAAAFWWFADRRAKRTAAPLVSERLEIRDGSRTVLLDPAEIAFVEAAGNYVELHTATATHLARGALASFETRLAPKGFVRVHRSRLVNRARIRAMKPTPAGDLEITLDDGRTLAASRRYRANLEAAPTL